MPGCISRLVIGSHDVGVSILHIIEAVSAFFRTAFNDLDGIGVRYRAVLYLEGNPFEDCVACHDVAFSQCAADREGRAVCRLVIGGEAVRCNRRVRAMLDRDKLKRFLIICQTVLPAIHSFFGNAACFYIHRKGLAGFLRLGRCHYGERYVCINNLIGLYSNFVRVIKNLAVLLHSHLRSIFACFRLINPQAENQSSPSAGESRSGFQYVFVVLSVKQYIYRNTFL